MVRLWLFSISLYSLVPAMPVLFWIINVYSCNVMNSGYLSCSFFLRAMEVSIGSAHQASCWGGCNLDPTGDLSVLPCTPQGLADTLGSGRGVGHNQTGFALWGPGNCLKGQPLPTPTAPGKVRKKSSWSQCERGRSLWTKLIHDVRYADGWIQPSCWLHSWVWSQLPGHHKCGL